MPTVFPWYVVGTSATTTTASAWNMWLDTGTGANTASSLDVVWTNWATSTTATTATYPTLAEMGLTPDDLLSPEDKERGKKQRLLQEMWGRWQRQAKERWNQRARDLATDLLLSALTDKQRADYLEHRRFSVEVGEAVYELHGHTIAGNVRLARGRSCRGHTRGRFCIHPNGDNPIIEDVMLAQKLMLETDEEAFLSIANWSS